MEQIELAISIMFDVHKYNVDLDGKPAVLHPLEVGAMGKNDVEKCVGFLHDVIEDSELTADDILDMGVDDDVVEALKILTHNKEITYLDYINNILESGNEVAINVKLNDLKHNLARGIAGGHTKQVEKHTKALVHMMLELGTVK